MEKMFNKRKARWDRRVEKGKQKGTPFVNCAPRIWFPISDYVEETDTFKVIHESSFGYHHYTKGWRSSYQQRPYVAPVKEAA